MLDIFPTRLVFLKRDRLIGYHPEMPKQLRARREIGDEEYRWRSIAQRDELYPQILQMIADFFINNDSKLFSR
jgi:hypothetical protein